MADRRTFLRGLVSLPMIGGGVTLIGSPTAAAVPVTTELRDRYIAWLTNELAAALFERDARFYASDPAMNRDWRYTRVRMPFYSASDFPDIERLTAWTSPSARAAVVLSAAGVPLTGGDRG